MILRPGGADAATVVDWMRALVDGVRGVGVSAASAQSTSRCCAQTLQKRGGVGGGWRG